MALHLMNPIRSTSLAENHGMFSFIGRRLQFILVGLLALLLAGCGGGGSGGGFSEEPEGSTEPPPPTEPLSITTDSLPDATLGQNYQALLEAQGGSGGYQWGIVSGQLPPGLSLEPTLGVISGVPTAAGTYPFVIQVQDPQNPDLQTVTKEFTIDVADQPATVKIKDIQLLVNSLQLPSSSTTPLVLTAVVRDINNNTVKDAVVTFKATNNATVQVTRGTTDEAGTAEARLSTAGYPANRQITVTASIGDVAASLTVDVVGTTLTIAGPTSVVLGDTVTFIVSLLNSAGGPIANQALNVSSRNQNTIMNPNPLTGSDGKAQVLIRGDTIGTDTITVSGAGAVAQQALNVSPDKFSFVGSNCSAQEIQLNTPCTVTVEWRQSGIPVVDQVVNFTATRGTIMLLNSGKTNANGQASATLQSTTAGRSLIVATTSTGLSIQLEVLFVANQAQQFLLQTNPTVIGPFQQSTITAQVFDAIGNPVKGKKINFNLEDATGGFLSNPFSVTNESGETTITYTSAATISGVNQIKITATVEGTALQRTVTLTVSRQTVFIRFATGNQIEVIDLTSYSKPYRVWLTDPSGNPVAGVTVTLRITPISYGKGYYNPPGTTIKDGTLWEQVTAAICANEDKDNNGILNIPPDVDENNNNRLEPGNVASVVSTVTTDSDGSALFGVKYGKNYANWVTVQLGASATVAGSEAVESTVFTLPIVVGDISNKDVPPPGNPSPFGKANKCADPN